MRFSPTPIPQLFVLETEPRADDRGYFSHWWNSSELASHGLNTACQQVCVAFNHRRGTLRGLHYQEGAFAEAKTVRVVRGAIHDVVLDLRPLSPMFGRWFACELSCDHGRALFVPEGCAHGYLTLRDNTEVLYVLSGQHQPQAERGVHWQCPVLQGAWPFEPVLLSPRDAQLPAIWPPASQPAN